MFKFVYHIAARDSTVVKDEIYRYAYAMILIDIKSHYGASVFAEALIDDGGWDILDDEEPQCWEYDTESLAEAMDAPEHGQYFREAQENGYVVVLHAYREQLPK